MATRNEAIKAITKSINEAMRDCRFDGVQNATVDNFLATIARMSA